jgi:hypothetical protein
MNETRRPKITTLRSSAPVIFGTGFDPAWFLSGHARGGEEVLCKWLGATQGDNTKVTYAPIPPILYLDGNTKNRRGIFKNPAVIRVSLSF